MDSLTKISLLDQVCPLYKCSTKLKPWKWIFVEAQKTLYESPWLRQPFFDMQIISYFHFGHTADMKFWNSIRTLTTSRSFWKPRQRHDSASREKPGWRRMAPYPGYALVPYFCRVAATPYPARWFGAQFAPFVGPRKRMDCTPKVGHPTE